MDGVDFLVCISCKTYNQSAYITEALNGFVMQQTNFPFVAVVIDDASTDGEQEVIKAYADEHFDHSEETGFNQWETEEANWTFARHKENGNCHLVAVYLKRNLFREPEKKEEVVKDWLNTKYIAFCEGDDYWTDPLKLQKQVDFLEIHEGFGFVGTNVILNNHGNMIHEPSMAPSGILEGDFVIVGDVFEYAKYGPPARIVSLLYKKELIEPYKSFLAGDIVLETILAKVSNYAYYKNHACVYRVGIGICSSMNNLERALRYNDWYVNCRRVQKKLFPEDFNWSEEELDDRGVYLRLIYAIREMKWKFALRYKRQLKSDTYKQKAYSKHLYGPCSCLLLWMIQRIKYHRCNGMHM